MKAAQRTALVLAALAAVGAVACFAAGHSFPNANAIYALGGTLTGAALALGFLHWLAGGDFREW